MTISVQQVLTAIAGASTITTAIFWGAFLLGRLHTRMERMENDVTSLGGRMDRAGNKMSDLADEIQKLPDRYLTRAEALMWNGSRAEDRK